MTRGGGIRIILFDNTCTNSSITLDNNTLEGNSAVFGGGALICVSGNTSNNKIQIFNNFFIGNNVSVGGGGLDVGYTTYRNSPYHPTNNKVFVSNSYFIGNNASYGGGLSTYASSVGDVEHYNQFQLYRTVTLRTILHDLVQQSVPVEDIFTRDGSKYINQVRFTDSKFENNVVIFKSISSILDGNQNGAFFYL